MKIINIAKDFTIAPGPRNITHGDKSGEEFRNKILQPAYEEARKSKSKILVILDGTFGYFDSFIEESFGGLKRKFPDDDVFSVFEFQSNEEPEWIEKIKEMIDEALNKKM